MVKGWVTVSYAVNGHEQHTKVKSSNFFIYTAQNHKSQFSVDFTNLYTLWPKPFIKVVYLDDMLEASQTTVGA